MVRGWDCSDACRCQLALFLDLVQVSTGVCMQCKQLLELCSQGPEGVLDDGYRDFERSDQLAHAGELWHLLLEGEGHGLEMTQLTLKSEIAS